MTRYTVGFDSQLIIPSPVNVLETSPEGDTLNDVVSEYLDPNYDQKLEEHGDERKNVEKLRMSEFIFEVASDTQNLNFLKCIEFFIEGRNGDKLKIGEESNVSKGFRVMNVGVTFPWDRDMRGFVENGYRIRVVFTADEAVESDVRIRCTSIFQVDTKKFGI